LEGHKDKGILALNKSKEKRAKRKKKKWEKKEPG